MRRRTFFGAALLLTIWPGLAEDTRPGTELTYRFTFGENAKERLAAAVEVIRARLGDRATIETKGADSVVGRIPTTDKKRVATVKKAHVPKMAALTRFEEDKYLAIVVNDRVHAAPLLRDTLSDRGVITGNYTEDEAHALASVLASGELEDRPVLVNETKTPAKAGTEK